MLAGSHDQPPSRSVFAYATTAHTSPLVSLVLKAGIVGPDHGMSHSGRHSVALGALSDGRKAVLAVQPGHRESTESWSQLLRALKERGMGSPRVVYGGANS
jgi:hypothetical protein